MKPIKYIKDHIAGSGYSLQERLFRLITLVGLIGLALGIAVGCFSGESLINLIAMAAGFVVLLVIVMIVFRTGKIQIGAIIVSAIALERVGVLEEYEGKHVASALIEYIINDVAKQGFDGIRLLVFGGNRRAEGLYIKKGFLHTGEAFGWGTLWQCYEMKLGNNDGKTEGTVVSSKECRWLKINTKPVRSHSLDGAAFPHIITVKYTVNGKEYLKKKYVSYKLPCPRTGDRLTVLYDSSRPKKAKVIL